nr:MAG TPA: hypothetical protein [Caudoviricetes sp.]
MLWSSVGHRQSFSYDSTEACAQRWFDSTL